MSKQATLDRIREAGVLLVVRAASAAQALDGIKAVLEGGVRGIEVTYTVPGAAQVIAAVKAELGAEVVLGAGTVTTPEQAREAVEAGATYLVAPNTQAAVIDAALSLGVPMFPGALTPTEVFQAHALGGDVVKIFPASLGGPAYLKALKGPFPQIPMVPTGGVDDETVGAFFKAGAFAVGAGGALFDPKKLEAKDWAGMTAVAKRFMLALEKGRSA